MSAATNSEATFLSHPRGLAILFFTEMWERFSYYGMRALLVIYLIANVGEGGLGWTKIEALTLYGWYTMAVYLVAIPGGIIADKLLGQKKTVMLGGFILVAGHFMMAMPGLWAFYTALTLIVIGSGFLKPNISTLVGGLYKQGDSRRDGGFMIFYMGINLGAMLGSILCGIIAAAYGWHIGFTLAGFGMLLGQIVYIWGQKYLITADDVEQSSIAKIETDSSDEILDQPKAAAEKIETLPLAEKKKIETSRLIVLGISFIAVCFFWMSFEQAGGLMSIYTEEYTNRMLFGYEIPTAVFQALNAAFILIFGTLVANFWVRQWKKGKETSTIYKMGFGLIILGIGFLFMVGASMQRDATGESAMYWLVFAYLFHTIGELCLSPTALSFITKLAPKRMVSSIMGIYFAVTGLANKLASEIGKSSELLGELTIFWGLVAFGIIVGVGLLLITKKLKAMAYGAEDMKVESAG
ncbi:peptide MFS transporter [bacterium]|nr:peptide MFS transporter [bacterium]